MPDPYRLTVRQLRKLALGMPYKLSYVGADGDEYFENYRSVQIDFAAQVVTVWASEDRLKGKRLAFYPRERIVRVKAVIA